MHTRVILNKDLSTLGEEGDVKDVAKGFARNFLFPRGIALPYTARTVALFESRKNEIEARKEQKRKDAASLKERLQALELTITMPAGANGKLYGAVTSLSIADELVKVGFEIERKRIDLPGNTVKNTGKYKATVRLYDNESAEVSFSVVALVVEQEKKPESRRERPRRRRDFDEQPPQETAASENPGEAAPVPGESAALAPETEAVPVETPATE
jgi:large subunit ribosomal protein L9